MHKTNHCFLIGNLGADPVERVRTEKSGPIVGFAVAENVRTFDRETNEFKTVHTNWFQITAFGSLAERVKNHLKRGDRVAIQGQMRSSRYTDKSGEERSGFEIVAEDIALWQPLGQTDDRDERPSAVRPVNAARPSQNGAHPSGTARRTVGVAPVAKVATASGKGRRPARDDEALPF